MIGTSSPPRRDPLLDIAEAAEALTDPRLHSEPRHEWDANRNRQALQPHKTTVPGLIQQLREHAEPGIDGNEGGAGGPQSCPAAIDAVSLLAAIEFGAAWRCFRNGVTRRDSAEGNIRALVGVAGRLDHDERRDLRNELCSWQHQAEVITGWRTPARPLPAPCPIDECGARGTLLAKADGSAASCSACGAHWDHTTIGLLARHVTAYRAGSDAAARAARSRAVAIRRRAEGAGTPDVAA